MNSQNFSQTQYLSPKDKILAEKLKTNIVNNGSIAYSSQGAENYIKAVQQGNIKDVLKKMSK